MLCLSTSADRKWLVSAVVRSVGNFSLVAASSPSIMLMRRNGG